MPIATGVAIFFLIWWVTLFAVLPWGVRGQHESGEAAAGTDPGAPALPMLGRKLLWTTIVAAAVFTAFYVVYVNHLIRLSTLFAPWTS